MSAESTFVIFIAPENVFFDQNQFHFFRIIFPFGKTVGAAAEKMLRFFIKHHAVS